jgi:hypothetical protein
MSHGSKAEKAIRVDSSASVSTPSDLHMHSADKSLCNAVCSCHILHHKRVRKPVRLSDECNCDISSESDDSEYVPSEECEDEDEGDSSEDSIASEELDGYREDEYLDMDVE